MLTDEGYISNYLGVNIKKNSDRKFKLSQSHLVENVTNHVGLKVSASLKAREPPDVKPLLHKTFFIPIRAVCSHSLVCSENSLLIVGIGPILNK